MKKVIVCMMIFVFLASFVSADLCMDSDDGEDYAEKGYVKYGVTKFYDTCVLNPSTDMSIQEGAYLKEYFCDDDKRVNDIIDCSREGFDMCKEGKCIDLDPSDDSAPKAPVYTAPVCGNKVVDPGEDCDPPDKICYKGSDIGLCSEICKCEIKIKDGRLVSDDENETTEVTDEQETEQEPKAETKTEVKKSTDPDGVPSTQIDRLSLPKEPKKGLFSRMLAWFAGWFD
jgi:major membrane immunogen (membrane-anchored lipoprotein)